MAELASEYKLLSPSQPQEAKSTGFTQEEAAKFVALVRDFEKKPQADNFEKIQAALPKFLEKFAAAPAKQQAQLQTWKDKAEKAKTTLQVLSAEDKIPTYWEMTRRFAKSFKALEAFVVAFAQTQNASLNSRERIAKHISTFPANLLQDSEGDLRVLISYSSVALVVSVTQQHMDGDFHTEKFISNPRTPGEDGMTINAGVKSRIKTDLGDMIVVKIKDSPNNLAPHIKLETEYEFQITVAIELLNYS